MIAYPKTNIIQGSELIGHWKGFQKKHWKRYQIPIIHVPNINAFNQLVGYVKFNDLTMSIEEIIERCTKKASIKKTPYLKKRVRKNKNRKAELRRNKAHLYGHTRIPNRCFA